MSGNGFFAVVVICLTVYQMWNRWLTHKERLQGLEVDSEGELVCVEINNRVEN